MYFNIKGGDLQLMVFSFSVYIHILVSYPDDDPSSQSKLAVMYKIVSKLCVGCD